MGCDMHTRLILALGIPVQHNLLSATVLGSSAAEADAMATAFMVIGKDSTLSLLKEKTYLSNYVYLIYDSAGGEQNIHKSAD